MAEAPAFADVLKQALRGLDNEDVRIFYAYFEELKRHARRHLDRKGQTNPGESAVVNSALWSFFQDLAVHDIPLSDVDEYGYPMLWPMLLQYIERHCDTWNKYHKAKKRQAIEVPIGTLGQDAEPGDRRGLDPADGRSPENEESHVVRRIQELYSRLREEEREVFDLWVAGKSLDETARLLQEQGRRCGVAKVSYVRKRIRETLEAL